MKKIFFLLLCFLLGVNKISAITLTCPEVASPGDKIVIKVDVQNYQGLRARYDFETGFVYQGISLEKTWKSYYDGANGFSIGNVNGENRLGLDISAKISNDVMVNKEYTLRLVDIEASTDGSNVKIDNKSCKVMMLSDINTLDVLSVDGAKISQVFNKNVLSYNGITKEKSVTINAIGSDKDAKVEGDIGKKNLDLGVNTFSIKVTSARGSVREYKIYITRETKNSDITLKKLKLSSGSLNYKRDVFFYSVDVENVVDNIEVEAIASDSKALVRIFKDNQLVVGENTVKVVVMAEDGTVATYVIVVNRKEKMSSNTFIKSLVIKNYELDFSSDIYEYDLQIDGEISLDIAVILDDERAGYTIKGNNNLKDKSIIEIEVMAEDGTVSVYKININKVGSSNSSVIANYIGVIPLVIFILFIVVVLIIKLINSKVVKFEK